MVYDTTGTYLAIGSLIVLVLSYFKIIVDENQVVTFIAGIVAIIGVIKQARTNKNLAVSAGILER